MVDLSLVCQPGLARKHSKLSGGCSGKVPRARGDDVQTDTPKVGKRDHHDGEGRAENGWRVCSQWREGMHGVLKNHQEWENRGWESGESWEMKLERKAGIFSKLHTFHQNLNFFSPKM